MLSFLMRTFALSLSIFWRALPCWALLAAILYAVFSFFAESPIIFLILLGFGAGTLMVFMLFVNVRSGLIVADEVTPTDLGKLFLRSFKFFRFFAIFNALMGGLSLGAFYIASQMGIFDFDMAVDAVTTGDPDALAELYSTLSRPSVYAYTTVTQILSQIAYASLAVPMAANAAACSPKARNYEIFWGFGAGALRMFLLMLVAGTIITGMVLVYGFVLLTMPVFDGLSLMQVTTVEELTAPSTLTSYLMIAVLVLFPIAGFVWFISLWCAGATLCFIAHRDKSQEEKDFEISRVLERPHSTEDLRALRMSRMRGTADG
ncbi:hypothetical protein [Neptunicoccus cionae]|uniref:Uncharacterized protein n=1 Tax=Neptunicoccus cionae TaxID=2035344 RepID=A0A916VM78_9RHOB|nr:hypothetical protein [Amylibacter cionae]GGA07385.1 hypothetical protein GCM10011498_04060 [Amylibacter cionae]